MHIIPKLQLKYWKEVTDIPIGEISSYFKIVYLLEKVRKFDQCQRTNTNLVCCVLHYKPKNFTSQRKSQEILVRNLKNLTNPGPIGTITLTFPSFKGQSLFNKFLRSMGGGRFPCLFSQLLRYRFFMHTWQRVLFNYYFLWFTPLLVRLVCPGGALANQPFTWVKVVQQQPPSPYYL